MSKEAQVSSENMKNLAAMLTRAISGSKSHEIAFMLTEPATLTTSRGNHGVPTYSRLTTSRGNHEVPTYSRVSHIGGESFTPVRAYWGKKGEMIYVFRPMEMANYVEMELPESRLKLLSGFTDYLKNIGGDLFKEMQEMKLKSSEANERARLLENKQYAAMGYGSW